ncbi:hypothetical protein CNECB9_10013 [Cupriavidus necator]|uniref:Uncharacterized protein n=1 Tax=Cupriavidus necator TaxID=106590 RepID=A0A1K0I7N8_CUPNE|nr:hypothetical protein CNECB9_10013 [Cupriavidus necator]
MRGGNRQPARRSGQAIAATRAASLAPGTANRCATGEPVAKPATGPSGLNARQRPP